MSADLRPATTVLLLRPKPGDPASGFEIFMVQRHRRSGFLPNAWVFPGGRVDDADHLHPHPRIRGGDAVRARLGLDDAAVATAFLVAGVRETFEEAGIWLGSGELPWSLREPLGRGQVDLAQVLENHDATIDLDTLASWSWWITPEIEPRRYDTRFLVANAEGYEGRHDDLEVVDSGWYDPRQVLEQASHGDFPMAPPTWWTLYELARHDRLEDVLEAAATRAIHPVQPVMRFDDQGLHLLLPGHPDHPDPAISGLPTRIEFEAARWVAYDGETRRSS